MASLAYFKWYPKDAETDEVFRMMTFEERGYYITCLDHCWINGSIPADSKTRAKLFGIRPQMEARLWRKLASKFEETPSKPGVLLNKRLEIERESAREKSIKATESVNVRYERTTTENKNVALRASDSVSVSDVVVLTETTNTEKTSPRARENFHADFFEKILEIFEQCGHRCSIADRIRCENYWKGLTSEDQEKAFACVMQQLDDWRERPTEAIPRPWNFLRDRQWDRVTERVLQPIRAPSKKTKTEAEMIEYIANL